jgi:hypothetical protein
MQNLSKIDIVMWTRNGQKTLLPVLKQLNTVIPKEQVGQRLIIDDDSTDLTKTIAVVLGWKVLCNEGKGISDAANTALKNVETPFFCSFEQDVKLSVDWWKYIPKMVSDKPCLKINANVAVASGIRVANSKHGSLRSIGLYEAQRYRSYLKNKPLHYWHHVFGMSLDNTCYNTKVLRELGGFPKVIGGPGVDVLLAKKLIDSGYSWQVNYDVVSDHIRKGVRDELKHYYWYGTCQKHIDNSKRAYLGLSGRMLFSPVRGLDIAVHQRNWQCLFVYPAIRFASWSGAIKEYVKDAV